MKNIFYRRELFYLMIILLALGLWRVLINRDISTNQNMIPKFSIKDIEGRLLSKRILLGRNAFVQFINPKNKSDIEMFNEVYTKWANKNLIKIAISDNFGFIS